MDKIVIDNTDTFRKAYGMLILEKDINIDHSYKQNCFIFAFKFYDSNDDTDYQFTEVYIAIDGNAYSFSRQSDAINDNIYGIVYGDDLICVSNYGVDSDYIRLNSSVDEFAERIAMRATYVSYADNVDVSTNVERAGIGSSGDYLMTHSNRKFVGYLFAYGR